MNINGLAIFIVLIAYRLASFTSIPKVFPGMQSKHDNGVFLVGKQEAKSLSFKTIEMMKPGDKDKADIGEKRGLHVSCGATGVKSFFYRYTSPLTGKLAQVKIGNFPQTSLAAARLKLNELKLVRQDGRCPATELKQENNCAQSRLNRPKWLN
ncbi:Arm DNA-binding domain-containing protein [Kosakonia arachidis]|uniref:Arm DNA-binding domain-containing protein n=1 Tax=Kosakonia arachidis TaxID=551989 RepID=UPI001FCC2514|nr:Arm DNA-binding domain-containing protein [Kosakonia arachidis]